jgi:hypothetical protein
MRSNSCGFQHAATGGSPTYRYRLCERLVSYYQYPSESAQNKLDPSLTTFLVDMNSLDLTTTRVEQQQQHMQAQEQINGLLLSLVTMSHVALSWLHHLVRLRSAVHGGPSSPCIDFCIAILQETLRLRGIPSACTTLALVSVFSASCQLSGLGFVPPASVHMPVVRSSFPSRYNGSSRTFSDCRGRHTVVGGEDSRMAALCLDPIHAGWWSRWKQQGKRGKQSGKLEREPIAQT